MSSELERALEPMKSSIANQIDEQILKFFGSLDDLLRYGHLYKVEAEPVRMEMMTHADLDFRSNTFVCQAIAKVRIRPKTLEELDADKHD